MRRAVAVLVSLVASVAVVVLPGAYAQPATYLETFTLNTDHPTPYRPPGFDVSVIGREDESIDPMWAEHGPNCEPPQTTWPGGQPSAATNHYINSVPQTVFSCIDHIMTAMNAGYGATYITVPALMDWSNGPARFEFDMSTQRTSSRDWMDVVIQPFEPGFDGPMALNFQDFHLPHDVIQLELQGGGNVWAPLVMLDGPAPGCGNGSYWQGGRYRCRFNFDGFNGWDRMLANRGLTVSATRRDHFMVEVSRTHLRMGFRVSPTDPYSYWVDADIPGGPLGWSQGVTQLNQRSYNPLKPCGPGVGDAGHSDQGWQGSCRAGTWHIDNMQISPYIPFTIIPGVRKINYPGGTVTFAQPAPANSYVKAAGGWSDTEWSIDNGATWHVAAIVGPKAPVEVGDSYWFPVPQGTQSIRFRGSDQRWTLQDVYLYSRTTGPVSTPTSTPTTEPTSTPTNTPQPTETPTAGPTATETPTSAPTSTSTVTVTPGASTSVSFDTNPRPSIGGFSGSYWGIDWGTRRWYYSGPYAQFTTNSVGFNGPTSHQESFTFVGGPKTLVSLRADNGAGAASTLTLACPGNANVVAPLNARTATTVVTGWSTACSTVTVTSSNGWDTNLDDLVYR